MADYSYTHTRDLLEATRTAVREFKRTQKQLEFLRATRLSIGSQDTTRVLVSSTSTDVNKTGRIDTFIDLAPIYEQRMAKDVELIEYTTSVIYGIGWAGGIATLLSSEHADVLKLRYIDDMTLDAIARITGLSRTVICMRIDEACDLTDAYGIERVRHGLGIATQ